VSVCGGRRSGNLSGGVAADQRAAAFTAQALTSAILRTLKIGSQNNMCGSRNWMPERAGYSPYCRL